MATQPVINIFLDGKSAEDKPIVKKPVKERIPVISKVKKKGGNLLTSESILLKALKSQGDSFVKSSSKIASMIDGLKGSLKPSTSKTIVREVSSNRDDSLLINELKKTREEIVGSMPSTMHVGGST